MFNLCVNNKAPPPNIVRIFLMCLTVLVCSELRAWGLFLTHMVPYINIVWIPFGLYRLFVVNLGGGISHRVTAPFDFGTDLRKLTCYVYINIRPLLRKGGGSRPAVLGYHNADNCVFSETFHGRVMHSIAFLAKMFLTKAARHRRSYPMIWQYDIYHGRKSSFG